MNALSQIRWTTLQLLVLSQQVELVALVSLVTRPPSGWLQPHLIVDEFGSYAASRFSTHLFLIKTRCIWLIPARLVENISVFTDVDPFNFVTVHAMGVMTPYDQ